MSARILYVMRDTMSGNTMLDACICVAGHSMLSYFGRCVKWIVSDCGGRIRERERLIIARGICATRENEEKSDRPMNVPRISDFPPLCYIARA